MIQVAGKEFPHLPFHGLWIDWSRFPLIDEQALVASQSKEHAMGLLKTALNEMAQQGRQQQAKQGSGSGASQQVGTLNK
jgi:hypothetical protein